MTNISSRVPEQSSRLNGIVMSVFTTAMLVVAGFVVLATPFAMA